MTDCTLEASMYHGSPEILVTIDTDSWIENEFQISETLERMLDEYREANSETDEGTIMETFPRYVYDRRMIEWNADTDPDMLEPKQPTGFYGDGEPVHVFTPNNENMLSQDVQFVLWEDENGSHVVLRKADAYNGYGAATAYDVLGCDGTEPLDYARAQVGCDGGTDPHPDQLALDGSKWEPCRASWDVEPGGIVDYGDGFGTLLRGYKGESDYAVEEGTAGVRGALVIDHDERVAYCPVCGSGRLTAYKF